MTRSLCIAEVIRNSYCPILMSYRKWILPILASFGALIAVLVVFWSNRKEPVPAILYPAPKSPYRSAIYGSGIIEASTENIAIGTPFMQPIVAIYVVEGDNVKTGDPLLKQDTRSLEAQKLTAESQLQAAKINFENARIQFSFYERLKDKKAVSEQAYTAAYYAMLEAEEQIQIAANQLNQILVDIDRSTIRAPVDGKILQVNAHIGEIYAPISYGITQSYSNLEAAQILMGTVSPLQMRIDIDEEDSWRFKENSKATAFVRGNSHINFPMKFLRIEPYIIPKTYFTGEVTERIDTRVLQVLYQFEQMDLPIYAGQLLDVYIEASPLQGGIP